MSETPNPEPEELRSPHLTPDEEARLEAIEKGGLPNKKAWQVLLNEVPKERRQEIETSIRASEGQPDVVAEAVAASQRVVEESYHLGIQPVPPQPGETDEQIRARHREFEEAKFRRAQQETPSDEEDARNREMLKRLAEGNFTPPDAA